MSGPFAVRPHVLVVESDLELQELLTLLLREEGYQVTSAVSLEQAAALLEQHTFHLILSDLFREENEAPLRGVEALRDRAWPIPVMIMTGWTISEQAAQQRGFPHLIYKPFDIDNLSATIATCLNAALTPRQMDQARIIERYYSAVNRHDSAAAADLCAEDFVYFPNKLRVNLTQTPVQGRERFRAYLEEIFHFYSGFQAESGSIVAHPRGLAVHYVMRWKGSDGSPRHRVSGLVFGFVGEKIAQLGQKSASQRRQQPRPEASA